MAKELQMKHAHTPQIRMAYIDRMIRAGKYPNCSKIAEHFCVNRKTIQRDLEYMRELGAPLQYNSKQQGFMYTEPNYFLPTIPMTQSAAFAFVINEQILKQYQDAPYYDDLVGIFEKLKQFMPDEFTSENENTIFSFTNSPPKKIEKSHLALIQKATFEEKQIKIKYRSQHTNEVSDRFIDPYAIKNHSGTWYLIAFCHKRNGVRIFAMHRIMTIEITETDFIKSRDFSIEEFLKDSFSIYRDENKYHVKLKFSPFQSRWIRECTWHYSQKITELDDGGLVFEVDVQGLEEIKRWVMQYGSEVEVLEPTELKDTIVNEIKKLNKIYNIEEK